MLILTIKYIKLPNKLYHTKESNFRHIILTYIYSVEYLTYQDLHMFRSRPASAPEHDSPAVRHPHLPPPEADALPQPMRWGQRRLLPPLPPHAGAGRRCQP